MRVSGNEIERMDVRNGDLGQERVDFKRKWEDVMMVVAESK